MMWPFGDINPDPAVVRALVGDKKAEEMLRRFHERPRLCARCGSPDVREVERVAGIEGEAVRYTVLGCLDCGFVAEVEA